MRRDLSSAAAIVMNTAEAASALLAAAPELARVPVATIPNGFDAGEFPAEPGQLQRGDRFRIVHAGHSHVESDRRHIRILRAALGGAVRGLDTGTRSHLYLVRAVKELLSRRPDLREVIEIHLVGRVAGAPAEAPSGATVHSHGYLSHDEAVAALREADLLFLPMHDLGGSRRARIVPGKTYEYLAAGPPILAAVPPGDARDLLQAAGNSDVCAPTDVPAMSRAIERRIDSWRSGEPAPHADEQVVRRFERRRLTRDLADVFDLVLEGGGHRAAEPTHVSFAHLSPSEVTP